MFLAIEFSVMSSPDCCMFTFDRMFHLTLPGFGFGRYHSRLWPAGVLTLAGLAPVFPPLCVS